MAEEKDVDLYDELAKALKSDEPVEEEKPSGASPEKPTEENTSEKEKLEETAELSEEEISKLTPRAQKRIRDLADKVKELAEKPEEKQPQKPAEKIEEKPQEEAEFKNVKEFLEAVEDEPSRNLLEKFYHVIKKETSTILDPLEKKNNESRFEQEFGKYEKIEGLSDHKDNLRKTFMRDPNQSLKALVGEVITDLQLNKVKPMENTPSSPNRGGKINTEDLDKEQLYDLLDTLK